MVLSHHGNWLVPALVLHSAVLGCGGGGAAVDGGAVEGGGLDGGAPADDAGPGAMGGVGIQATVNGEVLAVPGVRAVVMRPGGETVTSLAAMGRVGSAQVNFQLDIPGESAGSHACTATSQWPRVQFQRLDSSRNSTADTILGGTCQIDVTEVGPPGGLIRGTFSAHTENGSGVVDIVEGSFAMTRQS